MNKVGDRWGMIEQARLQMGRKLKSLGNLKKIVRKVELEATFSGAKVPLAGRGLNPILRHLFSPRGQRVTRIAQSEPPLEVTLPRIKTYGFCQVQREKTGPRVLPSQGFGRNGLRWNKAFPNRRISETPPYEIWLTKDEVCLL